ncbi:hypothetical protein OG496_26285 [Streptomyces sp. NBC_00988]|uniref:hypothetical protein n=1 Tax=Streptomyces sp. NBC_00988 TaxID=2903704 RepID=UPI00386A4AE4|nr:hypothetical protein OG496_26285 [Streptomyces sp. NBC_00988]
MRGLIKQLRVSLLVTLGLSVFDLSHEVLRATRSGNYLAAVGDWAVWTAVICLCVAVVHAVIYGAVHTGRPGSGEARGVWVGLLVLQVFGLLLAWPLWTRVTDGSHTTGSETFLAAVSVLVILLPLLTSAAAWGWTRLQGTASDIARNRALFFGILALLPQMLAAGILWASV